MGTLIGDQTKGESPMNFYNNTHPYYCGIDLHARLLYVCILNNDGKTLVHKEIPANPDKLHNLLKPYLGIISVNRSMLISSWVMRSI